MGRDPKDFQFLDWLLWRQKVFPYLAVIAGGSFLVGLLLLMLDQGAGLYVLLVCGIAFGVMFLLELPDKIYWFFVLRKARRITKERQE